MSSGFAIRPDHCPACGPSLFVRYAQGEMGVRCLRCRATPVTLSLVTVLKTVVPRSDLPNLRVFELSSRGALVRYLRRRGVDLTVSEFFDDVAPGEVLGGISCQDVMALTFEDASFDLCTSTEVFEHVPDDARGFAEILRVLKPGGHIAFTVPLNGLAATETRAMPGVDGPIHLLAPEYHGDRIRGKGGVLCYRTYGDDIVDRLMRAGFASARLVKPARDWFGFSRTVVVGLRG